MQRHMRGNAGVKDKVRVTKTNAKKVLEGGPGGTSFKKFPQKRHPQNKIHLFPKYIKRTEMSAGLTPLMREACPIVSGRNLASFCAASMRRPLMAA